MPTPNLSLCVITRNEAARLPVCLASVKGLVDEIVVVDTGSTDDTVDIARAAGAFVQEIKWPGGFSAARNVALQHASGRWILVLDADESLPPSSVSRIRDLVAQPAKCAYSLVQRSRLPEGHHLDVAIVRLFPRDPRVRFERPIHEQVNTSLERARIPIRDTAITFDHEGYAFPAAMPEKTRRNQKLIESALAADPRGDPHLRFFYAATFFDTGNYTRAAREYEKCAAQCGKDRPKLANTARLKAAESLVRCANHNGAKAMLELEAPAGNHPLSCWLRGDIAQHEGNTAEAIAWWERTLAFSSAAYLPPVPLGPLKLQTLMKLAEAWAQFGRKDVGVSILKLAMALNRSGGQVDGLEAADRYNEITSEAVRV